MKPLSINRLLIPLLALTLALLACSPQVTIFETPSATNSGIGPITQQATNPDKTAIAATEPATNDEASQPTTIIATRSTGVIPAKVPTVEGDVSLHHAAMRAGFEGDVDAFARGTRYAVALVLNTNPLMVTGAETVRFLNTYTSELEDVVFRLYPNTLSSDDYTFIDSVSINGEFQTPHMERRNTVLRVLLPEPLAPGSSVDIVIAFSFQLPDNLMIGGGRISNTEGITVLSSFLPLLSIYEDGEWWQDFAPVEGDPAFTDAALFDVTLRAPSHMEISSSGTAIDQEDLGDGTMYYHFVTGPMRDFTLATAGDYEFQQGIQDGVTINVWSTKGFSEADHKALEVTAECVRIFNEQFGEYPYAELDVVESPMNGAAGIEYPGVYYIEDELWNVQQSFYEFVLVHETAHQWWYGIVGNNQVQQPWLDEALADYSVEVYYRELYGEEYGEEVRESYEGDVRAFIGAGNPSMPIGLPVESYSGQEYGVFVYEAGALLYSHFAEDYGNEAVSAMLSDYFQRFKYRIAHSADIEELVRVQLGDEASETFRRLVYGE